MISLASAQQCDQVWNAVAPRFAEIIADHGGDLTLGYLWQEIRSGRAFLLVDHDETEIAGASIWRPEAWMDGQKLRCLGLFGSGDWFSAHNEIVRGLMAGCGADALVFEGRRGWSRAPQLKGLRVREIRTLYEVKD